MRRRFTVLMLIAALTACGGPTKPTQGLSTPNSLSITGNQSFTTIGQSGQLTVFQNYPDGTRQDVTSLVTFAVQNPSVITVAPGGAVKVVGYGSTTVTAALQSMSASVTIQVNLTVTGLTLSPTIVNLTALGQTSQLTLTAAFADGSTKDVTAEAAWMSDASQIASVVGGLATATGLGQATVMGRYPAFAAGTNARSKSASIVVTPPGTFVLSGRTRDPGSGELEGVTITHQASGQTTTSSSFGTFTLGGLTDGLVTFDRPIYERAVVDTSTLEGTTLKTVDVPMQPISRINAGESATRSIAPHDMDYEIGAAHCYPCLMIHVMTPSSGTLHLNVNWTDTQSMLHVWVNGVDYPGEKAGPASVSADVPVAGGDVLVYVGQAMNTNARYVTFTIASSMR